MKRKRPVGRPKSKAPMKAALTIKLPDLYMAELRSRAIKHQMPVAHLARLILLNWMEHSK